MSSVTVQKGVTRIAYDMMELVMPSLDRELVGFEPLSWQPYPRHLGKRLSAPALNSPSRLGFTEIVQASDGLQAIITDWPAGASRAAIWAETVPAQCGYLYIGLEGDGRVEMEGLGHARRSGPSCAITIAPPASTQVWRSGPGLRRRGVCIVFHARYLHRRYPEMLRRCTRSLGPWLSTGESQLRDFEIPLLPVMQAATAALLSTTLEGEFRHAFVGSTVEQLLCLAIAALVDRESVPVRLSRRDRETLAEVRTILDQHLADPPTVEDLAQQFGTNRNKLRLGFKEVFGTSVADYLFEQRMRVAFELLERSCLSVTEVAARCGYPHVCNFTTAFKRRFGQRPTDVRNIPSS